MESWGRRSRKVAPPESWVMLVGSAAAGPAPAWDLRELWGSRWAAGSCQHSATWAGLSLAGSPACCLLSWPTEGSVSSFLRRFLDWRIARMLEACACRKVDGVDPFCWLVWCDCSCFSFLLSDFWGIIALAWVSSVSQIMPRNTSGQVPCSRDWKIATRNRRSRFFFF